MPCCNVYYHSMQTPLQRSADITRRVRRYLTTCSTRSRRPATLWRLRSCFVNSALAPWTCTCTRTTRDCRSHCLQCSSVYWETTPCSSLWKRTGFCARFRTFSLAGMLQATTGTLRRSVQCKQRTDACVRAMTGDPSDGWVALHCVC